MLSEVEGRWCVMITDSKKTAETQSKLFNVLPVSLVSSRFSQTKFHPFRHPERIRFALREHRSIEVLL